VALMLASCLSATTSCALLEYWGDGGVGASAGSGGGAADYKSGATDEFSERTVSNQSTASARLVELKAKRGDDTETVTFTFADTEVLPKYRVHYVDALRSHPEDDPLPLAGNAVLQVEFRLTNPNTDNRMAVQPNINLDQPQIKQVLLARNVGGSLIFGIGLENRAAFRVQELSEPSRLVVEVQTS